MRKELREDRRRVADAFLTVETAADTAATAAAQSLAGLMQVRARAKLPLNTGIGALSKMARISALLVEARHLTIELHPELVAIGEDPTIRSWGDSDDCPGVDKKPSGELLPLRSVA